MGKEPIECSRPSFRGFRHPRGNIHAPLKALIFDSWFDVYRGVVVLLRLIDGRIDPGMKIRLLSSNQAYEVDSVGTLTPEMKPTHVLLAGEVGYMIATIKRVSDTRIGDTVTEDARPTAVPLPGFQKIKPMVFAGLFPLEPNQHDALRSALEKLRLNDASFFLRA